jgi:hypothetical protein
MSPILISSCVSLSCYQLTPQIQYMSTRYHRLSTNRKMTLVSGHPLSIQDESLASPTSPGLRSQENQAIQSYACSNLAQQCHQATSHGSYSVSKTVCSLAYPTHRQEPCNSVYVDWSTVKTNCICHTCGTGVHGTIFYRRIRIRILRQEVYI